MTSISTDEDIAHVLATIDSLQRKLTELRKRIYRDIRTNELPRAHADLLSCRVGDSLVALPLERVQTVAQRCALTPIPEAPSWVAGLLDFHGDTVPVLDLRARLQGQPAAPALSDILILCRDEDRRAALLAQALGDVHLDAAIGAGEDLHEVPHGPYVMAVAHLGGTPAVVLSIPRLLAALDLPEEHAA